MQFSGSEIRIPLDVFTLDKAMTEDHFFSCFLEIWQQLGGKEQWIRQTFGQIHKVVLMFLLWRSYLSTLIILCHSSAQVFLGWSVCVCICTQYILRTAIVSSGCPCFRNKAGTPFQVINTVGVSQNRQQMCCKNLLYKKNTARLNVPHSKLAGEKSPSVNCPG